MVLIIVLCDGLFSQQENTFINGVDLSFIPQVEDNSGVFYSDGKASDPVDIFYRNSANYARFRLWHTPAEGYCNLEKTLQMAARAKAGMKVLLDFHYSDTWADPSNQYKPAAWKNVTYPLLLDSIYNYTYRVIHIFDSLGIPPEMVQIGNEINTGMLWPDGRIDGDYETTQQWSQFTNLLKKGIQAVHDAASDTVKIMIHYSEGGSNSKSRWFYDSLKNYEVNYDIAGLSYYPWWHGNLTDLRQNLNDLALRYNKEIIVAETAYPWTLLWNDDTTNIVGSNEQLLTGYPDSVQGQYSFLYDLIRIIKEVPGGKGLGFFYWAPDWISAPTLGSSWENLAMFDFEGNALSSLKVFEESKTDAVEDYFAVNSYSLCQNYPNPFNNSTLIKFELRESAPVTLVVFDILGRKIKELVNKELESGVQSIYWDAKDSNGKEVSSGIYLIRMNTQGFGKSIKSILLR
jgi:arabinogalactan endo-1,4-beta-galactosidase